MTIPYWAPGAVAIGLLMFLVGCLTIVVHRVLDHLVVEDPAPDHEDDLTALMDAVKAGAMVPEGSRYARLHRDCATAWADGDYDNVGDCCFDLLGRANDVGLDIFAEEVTQ